MLLAGVKEKNIYSLHSIFNIKGEYIIQKFTVQVVSFINNEC